MKSEISSTVSGKSGSSTASKMVKMVSVVSTIQTGHEDVVHDAQMDQFGLRLATCSSDASVRVYDVKTNEFMAELRGHEGPVWQIAWAPPVFGSLLASCSFDQKVIIWQESGGKWNKLYESKIHEGSVNSVCWGPAETGLTLAAGSSDGSISFFDSTPAGGWDVFRLKDAHDQGCNAVTWASHLSQKPKGVKRRLATGGNDNHVKVWCETAEGWKEESRLELHGDWVRDVAWAPFAGMPVNVIASCSQDRTVVIWKEDCRKECGKWTPTVLPVFDDVLWHVSWSMIGNILAVSGGDNRITLWKEGVDGNWFEMSKAPEKQEAKEEKDGDGSQIASPPVLA